MSKKILIGFILILLIALVSAGYYYIIKSQSDTPIIIDDYIDKKDNEIKEANITVEMPNDLSFPFEVKGRARVFENMLSVRVIDAKTNGIIFEEPVMANAPDVGQFGDYNKTIDYFYKKPESEDVIIEAFWHSPKDGAEIDKVSAMAKIKIENESAIKVFFNNSLLNPEQDCNKVFPVERIIPKTQAPAQKSIELLIKGLSSKEKSEGYGTSINYDTKINKITIENGTAKADFNETLEFQIGGSCLVSSIRAQITETLKQFPTVKNVVISINGRVEDILQP